jgi:hypothetical protein
MNITIERKSKDSISLFAYAESTYYPLFQFEYRDTEEMGGPAWYFWIRGNYDPDIFKGSRKEFPMGFFKDACRAKVFIYTGSGLHDDVEIVKGELNLSK